MVALYGTAVARCAREKNSRSRCSSRDARHPPAGGKVLGVGAVLLQVLI
jgi:hypothetical protein